MLARLAQWARQDCEGSAQCPLAHLHSALELRAGISYNAVDGAVDRRSFHGAYAVQDGLPL